MEFSAWYTQNPDGLRQACCKTNTALVDHLLYWIPCQDMEEAHYLLAIINSDVLKEAVLPVDDKGPIWSA